MAFLRSVTVILLLVTLLLLRGDSRVSKTEVPLSVERLRDHLRQMQTPRDPHDHPVELEQAAQYIRTQFLESGWKVTEDPFPWNGRIYKNIVAEKRGERAPHQFYILGAHYDSVPESPGADDNASAVAVLLEIGRGLRSVPTGTSLKLIAFCLEEVDYVGSTHYAERAKREGEKILGMIALEMVGFTGTRQDYPSYVDRKRFSNVGDFIGIVGNVKSEPLLERVRRSCRTHVPELPVESLVVPGNGEGLREVRLSDHSPFWDEGYQALLVTDTAFLRNPNYHLPTDTMETLDFGFMKKVATGVFHAVVDLANGKDHVWGGR